MYQLPGYLFSQPPRRSVCQICLKKDKAKKLKQSWRAPSAVFVAPAALQNKFALSSKISINPGSLPKTHTHILPTSGKYIAGFLVKSIGDVAGVRY